MSRRNLADLVREQSQTGGEEEAQQGAAGGKSLEERREVVEQPQDRGEEAKADPLYLRLQRKEARLREDQVVALSRISRHMNRTKGRKVERITENTLIRVAVDMLLEREEEIRGASEAEIRDALKRAGGAPLGPRSSGEEVANSPEKGDDSAS